jgi:hypothetical protein
MLQQTNQTELERLHRLAILNDWDQLKHHLRNELQRHHV